MLLIIDIYSNLIVYYQLGDGAGLGLEDRCLGLGLGFVLSDLDLDLDLDLAGDGLVTRLLTKL